jgi:hypothetical protein
MAKKTAKTDLAKVDRDALAKVIAQRKYQLIKVADICPNPYNKNRMGLQYYAALKANIADPRVGFTIPVLVRPNPDKDAKIPWMVIDGEHRWRASQEVGYAEIPCIVFPQMPEALAQYLMVESNAVHGTTDDADIKKILSTVESDEFLKGLDVWANTVTDAPIEEDTRKYDLGDDDLANIGNEATVPVTLFLKRPEQIDRFRVIVGQIRLTNGCTQEEAVMQIVDHFAESTGFGEKTGDEALDLKQGDLVQKIPKKGKSRAAEQAPGLED